MNEAPPISVESTIAPKPGAVARLRDFSDALRQGDTQAALEAARDACLAAPEMAEAHYAYGQAWMAAGKPARAEQAFATAAKLHPAFADAWINYGLARYAQGAIGEAKSAMARALQEQPGHPAATSNLAALLRLTGGYEAAETLLREALARNPHDTGARLNLVDENLQEEKPAEALALLNEVDPPADDIAAARHWHLQRALALIAVGRPDKSRTALAEFGALGPTPPELVPLRLWRDALLALAEGRREDARAYAEALEAALARDLGGMIGEQDRLMKHWKGAPPLPILTVRLDDWVRDFDATLARVLTHVGLPPDPACARFYETDSRVRTVSRSPVKQPVNARGLGRWKAYAEELAPLIEELERAGALEGWREGERAPSTATHSPDPVPAAERSPL